MKTDIIKKLVELYTEGTHPNVATTVSQSLNQLSSGIYTEEERFIFELLQNAVDAFSGENTLSVKIAIKGNYLVFMHNGAPFSARDVEGLCDVGNGNKQKDINKIGYKGIGFKSVFMCSTCVTIKSGDYCFKFDKDYWEGYWDKHWISEYGEKDPERKYLMPWQILPIMTTPPIDEDVYFYNVVTYIKLNNLESFNKKINKLLSNSNFLLFLGINSIQVDFTINGKTITHLSKKSDGEVVKLFSSRTNHKERTDSCWIVHSNNNIPVPMSLAEKIATDINTPQKLKDAQTFDLSFAIAVDEENGNIKRIDDEDAVVYTYLPTSFKFGTTGLPFLVNANFITDAGRQQLRIDSEWNKLIFSMVPDEYLKWMSYISSEFDDYYIVLPQKSYGDNNPLEVVYNESMQKALEKNAFIPKLYDKNKKCLVSEAIIDRIGLSEIIPTSNIIKHINNKYSCCFNKENFTANKGVSIFRDYGVFIFEAKHLNDFFKDVNAYEGIEADVATRLTLFLFEFYFKIKKKEEQEEMYKTLRNTSFLLSENDTFLKPGEIYFPSNFKENNKLAESSYFLQEDLYNSIRGNYPVVEWLKLLGVQELSDESFIRDSICSSGFITIENSIEITKYLYELYKRGNLKPDIITHLRGIKFLTKEGTLKRSNELYFGSKYSPEIDIESVCDNDIFISEEYVTQNDFVQWRMFLTLLGINASFKLTKIRFEENLNNEYPLLNDAWKESKKISDFGYSFQPRWFLIEYYPLIEIKETSHDFAKVVWSYILSKPYTYEDLSCIRGHIGDFWNFNGYDNSREPKINTLTNKSIREIILRDEQLYPTTIGNLLKASDIYINSEINIDLGSKYLPVLDLKCSIESNWHNLLPFKTTINVNSLLDILTKISEATTIEQTDKDRICKIYNQIVCLGALYNDYDKESITEWASSNKILSTDNVFVSPNQLKHITLEGFGATDRVYIGNDNNNDKLVKLLEILGVKVITEDNISTKFDNCNESDEFRTIFSGKLPLLALLSAGTKADQSSYNNKLEFIKCQFNDTHFYHCDKISLTYGNNNDVIDKLSLGIQNAFYYTGDLRPSNVEPLLESLCNFFDIRKHERELFIIMIDTYDGVCANLKEKGYPIELLPKDQIFDSGTISVNLGGYNPSESQKEMNIITGFKGEIHIYELLKKQGYTPICLSISNKDDYDHIVNYNGKDYYCKVNYANYDIAVTNKRGENVYIEVKTTTRTKTSQENMPISYNELSMLESSEKAGDKYYIARVFDIESSSPDIYMFQGQLFCGDTILIE